MDNISLNRLKHACEVLDGLREELLPCYVQWDRILRMRLDTEYISEDLVLLSARVGALEDALGDIKSCRDNLDYILDFFKKKGE